MYCRCVRILWKSCRCYETARTVWKTPSFTIWMSALCTPISSLPIGYRFVRFCLLGFNIAFKHLMLPASAMLPACSSDILNNVLPRCRHGTWHPTLSQYTDTGPTCRCAIHWCAMSHWNTQLPILIPWVRPDREILLRLSTHTSECSTL